MAGRQYVSEQQYRLQVLRDNETRKLVGGLLGNLGAALIAGAAVQLYTKGFDDDPLVLLWFLVAIVLICIGIAFVRGLQTED